MKLDLAVEAPANAAIDSLRRLDDAVLDDIIIAAGQVIASDAKGNAPVDTGTLRRSITVEAVAPGDVRVGSDVPYAARIEFGFNATDSRGRQYHQAAQPYLRPAFDANQDQVMRMIADGVRDLFRAAAGV